MKEEDWMQLVLHLLGVVFFSPWPDGQPEYNGTKLAKWDTLSADEKKLFARQAEVFAAYVAYTDCREERRAKRRRE